MAKAIVLGSVSSGTMRSEDVLPALYYEWAELGGAEWDVDLDRRVSDYIEAHEGRDYDLQGHELVDEIFDALNELPGRPPFVYFGAHPGDGADYGWWVDVEQVEESRRGAVVVVIGGEEYELLDGDYLLHVNDHGNMSMHHVAVGAEIWGVV